MTTPTTTGYGIAAALALAAALGGYHGLALAIGEEGPVAVNTEISEPAAADANQPVNVLFAAATPAAAAASQLSDEDARDKAGQLDDAARDVQTLDYKERSPAEVKIEAALSEVSQIEFTDTPLADAVEFLSELHQITIVLDVGGLNEEGIATDEPINRVVSGLTLKSTLRLILDPLGLDYLIKNEVMMITTRIRADETMETRVYDISGLSRDMPGEELVEVIQLSIRSEYWETPVASAKALADCLVITQSQRVHAEIRDLLTQLLRHQSRTSRPRIPTANSIGLQPTLPGASQPASVPSRTPGYAGPRTRP